MNRCLLSGLPQYIADNQWRIQEYGDGGSNPHRPMPSGRESDPFDQAQAPAHLGYFQVYCLHFFKHVQSLMVVYLYKKIEPDSCHVPQPRPVYLILSLGRDGSLNVKSAPRIIPVSNERFLIAVSI